jgi:hypothetical protein
MEEPKTKKDIQKLNGRVAAVNRFISRSTERSLPFFKALKGKGKIEWGPEESKAFSELKEYIEKMAILSPPSPSEPLFLYVAASKAAVSAALVREVDGEKGKHQSPVYFISEALSGSKLLHSELEKIAYAVVMAMRKLKHYFKAHKVTALADQPINDLFINKEASSRIAKWATELSEHTIDFGKRSAIKLHVLADFVVDWTCEHGYPWVPTDQAHGRPRQVGPAYQKTRRPVSRPARPDMWNQRCEDSLTCKTRQSKPIKAARISFPYCN